MWCFFFVWSNFVKGFYIFFLYFDLLDSKRLFFFIAVVLFPFSHPLLIYFVVVVVVVVIVVVVVFVDFFENSLAKNMQSNKYTLYIFDSFQEIEQTKNSNEYKKHSMRIKYTPQLLALARAEVAFGLPACLLTFFASSSISYLLVDLLLLSTNEKKRMKYTDTAPKKRVEKSAHTTNHRKAWDRSVWAFTLYASNMCSYWQILIIHTIHICVYTIHTCIHVQ